jgi:hypothetical protein
MKSDVTDKSLRHVSVKENAVINNAFTHPLIVNEMPEEKRGYSAYKDEMPEEQEACSAYKDEMPGKHEACSAYKDKDSSGNEHLSTKGTKMASTKVVTFKDILMMNSDKGVTDVVTSKAKGLVTGAQVNKPGLVAGAQVNKPESPEDEVNHISDCTSEPLVGIDNKEERKFTSYPHNLN